VIEKVGPARFKTKDGVYTTCKDCPKSWSLFGSDMDLEVEGYAYINNMLVQVNEVPLFYFPYVAFPVKTQRESGFLFPSFGSSEKLGFRYVQPYFWAMGRSHDSTWYLGHLTKRGWKVGNEYRFVLDFEKSEGIGNFWALRDVVADGEIHRPYNGWRWGVDWKHRVKLSRTFSNRFLFKNVSDTSYLRDFSDIPGGGEISIKSKVAGDFHFSPAVVNISGSRNRSLISPLSEDPSQREFPVRAVQTLPELNFQTNRLSLLKTEKFSFWYKSDLLVSRYWRGNADYLSSFDRDAENIFSINGLVPAARQAERIYLRPQFSMDHRIADRFLFRPSIAYNATGLGFQ